MLLLVCNLKKKKKKVGIWRVLPFSIRRFSRFSRCLYFYSFIPFFSFVVVLSHFTLIFMGFFVFFEVLQVELLFFCYQFPYTYQYFSTANKTVCWELQGWYFNTMGMAKQCCSDCWEVEVALEIYKHFRNSKFLKLKKMQFRN